MGWEFSGKPIIIIFLLASSSGPLCSRPPSQGPCKNFRMNWYHDAKENKCKQFQYGGCFGNQNNFASEEDCMKVCPQGENNKFELYSLLGTVRAFVSGNL